MTDKEKETRMLKELNEKPVEWFVGRPEKIETLRDWALEFDTWYVDDPIRVKYVEILLAAGFEYCDSCCNWVEASRVVHVDWGYSCPDSPVYTRCYECNWMLGMFPL